MLSVCDFGDKLMSDSEKLLPNEDPLQFPCRFEIKAMGRQCPQFESQISGIVNRHLSGAPILGTRSRCSRQGRYVSVTSVEHAVGRQQ